MTAQHGDHTIIIVGMGAGVSLGVAEAFGAHGFRVGMVSRDGEKLRRFQQQLAARNIRSEYATADAGDTAQLVAAVEALAGTLGRVDVLMYNAIEYRMGNVMDQTADTLTQGFRTGVGNALMCVKALRAQLAASKGAVLLTGGGSANSPSPDMSVISLSKAGILNLAKQLHPTLRGEGIYVGTLTINAAIEATSPTHSPTMLGEKFWELYERRAEVERVY